MKTVGSLVRRMKRAGDSLLCRVSPRYRAKQKYIAELGYWKGEIQRLRKWFLEGTTDWWGIKPPTAEQKAAGSDLWTVNAVMTMHQLRPSYFEELKLEADVFRRKRVLEVGCGPLAPLQQFPGCERHGLDPLLNLYVASGWPLYAYDAKFVNSFGESMPYPDAYFDAVISVNALDHVDNFARVAAEMQRVLKVGGGVYFEVEYHEPTVTEPLCLNDETIQRSFPHCKMTKLGERGKQEMFQALVARFGLIPDRFHFGNEERFAVWHGTRIS